jgi:hypothetical protein
LGEEGEKASGDGGGAIGVDGALPPPLRQLWMLGSRVHGRKRAGDASGCRRRGDKDAGAAVSPPRGRS